MVDIFCVHHAAKISWIRRLNVNKDENLKLIMLKRMDISQDQLDDGRE